MDLLRKYWPHAFKDNVIVAIIVYLLIDIVLGFVIGLLAGIPVIGFIFSLVGSLLGLYCTVGIILAILNLLKVFK